MARDRDSTWSDPTQTGQQVRLNRSYRQVQGSIYFSSKSLMNNPLAVRDSLRERLYPYPALVPVMPWKDSVAPLPPTALKTESDRNGVHLSWQTPATATDGDTARYYVVYRTEGKKAVDVTNASYIIGTQWVGRTFTDENVEKGKRYQYAVTAVDRLHNESIPSSAARGKGKKR